MNTNGELKKMIEELEAKTALEIEKLQKQYEKYLLDAQNTAENWKKIDEVLKKQLDEVCKPLLAAGVTPIAEALKELGQEQKTIVKREPPKGFLNTLKKLIRKNKK